MTWLADVVLGALGLEALMLLLFGPRLRLSRATTLTVLAPGAALVLALRFALAGDGVGAIGGALLVALVAHGAEFWRRWQLRE